MYRIFRMNRIKSSSHFNYESPELHESDPNPVNPVKILLAVSLHYQPQMSKMDADGTAWRIA
jgi:hypothetical protein